MKPVADILQRILATKRDEIALRSDKQSLDDIRAALPGQSPPRPFRTALEAAILNNQPGVIAEIKRASPSKGVIREPFNVSGIAASYADHGATCLSVLTDEQYFQGCADYLRIARQTCGLPVLRKDFILDPWQVYESRFLGADCILLIVAALDDALLKELYALAGELGMDVLVEVHDEEELERAAALGARLIGINNRDLHTFHTSLDTTLRLAKQAPDGVTLVTESGINSSADVLLMRRHGVNGFLIGEACMRAPDPGAKLAELFTVPVP